MRWLNRSCSVQVAASSKTAALWEPSRYHHRSNSPHTGRSLCRRPAISNLDISASHAADARFGPLGAGVYIRKYMRSGCGVGGDHRLLPHTPAAVTQSHTRTCADPPNDVCQVTIHAALNAASHGFLLCSHLQREMKRKGGTWAEARDR